MPLFQVIGPFPVVLGEKKYHYRAIKSILKPSLDRDFLERVRCESHLDLTHFVDIDGIWGRPLDELVDPIEADVERAKDEAFGETQLLVGQQSVAKRHHLERFSQPHAMRQDSATTFGTNLGRVSGRSRAKNRR